MTHLTVELLATAANQIARALDERNGRRSDKLLMSLIDDTSGGTATFTIYKVGVVLQLHVTPASNMGDAEVKLVDFTSRKSDRTCRLSELRDLLVNLL